MIKSARFAMCSNIMISPASRRRPLDIVTSLAPSFPMAMTPVFVSRALMESMPSICWVPSGSAVPAVVTVF